MKGGEFVILRIDTRGLDPVFDTRGRDPVSVREFLNFFVFKVCFMPLLYYYPTDLAWRCKAVWGLGFSIPLAFLCNA